MQLTGDRVYLQIAGIFVWSGTPAAFQVVTRAIAWEMKHALKSRTLMYVDDIIGVGLGSLRTASDQKLCIITAISSMVGCQIRPQYAAAAADVSSVLMAVPSTLLKSPKGRPDGLPFLVVQ
jgi:hypothetical protein